MRHSHFLTVSITWSIMVRTEWSGQMLTMSPVLPNDRTLKEAEGRLEARQRSQYSSLLRVAETVILVIETDSIQKRIIIITMKKIDFEF